VNRSTEIVIDSVSWFQGEVPPDIAVLAGPRTMSVPLALLFTALSTRPPTVQGFYLADFWAWLRYAWAFDGSPNLRLRREWESVDPHQKAVLSDELGVGFTTYLLSTGLGCSQFIDTLYFVNVLEPGSFSLTSSAKRGPKKSPDYIARDGGSNYYVLECKGTQSNLKELAAAIGRGQKQKASLTPQGGTTVMHSLVAGLFIPSWKSSELSQITIADPSWHEFEELLANRSTFDVNEALVQIALAKSFALVGLPETANAFVTMRLDERGELPPPARGELRRRRRSGTQPLDIVFDTADLQRRADAQAPLPWHARFLASAPGPLVAALDEGQPARNLIQGLVSESARPNWHTDTGEAFAELQTPLGFTLRVEVR
jgi:hypothetical protein